MEKEVLFAQTLEKVKRTAKEQGNCISEQQVREAFTDLSLKEDQLSLVFDYLEKHKIGIDEPGDPDGLLSDADRDYLQDYLDELSLLPAVSDNEKEAFTIGAMAGDRSAQQKLIEVYLPDVVEIAKLYAGQGVVLEDLVGEGNVALALGVNMLGCLEQAAEAQGMLARRIMDAMEEYITENAANQKTDKKVADKVNQISEKAKELAEELKRKVTPQELAQEAGISLKAVMNAVRISGFQIEDIEVTEDAQTDL